MDMVFFIYGLAFFSLGLAILVQPKVESQYALSRFIRLLAFFGLAHGAMEWMEIWKIANGDNATLRLLKVVFLFISNIFLFEFGRRLTRTNCDKVTFVPKLVRKMLGMPIYGVVALGFLFELLMIPDRVLAITIASRYFLGGVGSFLAGIGFFQCADKRLPHQAEEPAHLWGEQYYVLATISFVLYGLLGGLVVPAADVIPANIINNQWFLETFEFPVQLFRATCAIMAAYAVVNILRIFHLEIQERLLSSLKLAEKDSEALNTINQVLSETLLRLEDEIQTRRKIERHLLDISEEEQMRIGRELHDDIGQLLTGAAYLAGSLSRELTGCEPGASKQAQEIASVIQKAMKHTRYLSYGMIAFNITNRGLVEGLRQLAKDVSSYSGISCSFSCSGDAEIDDITITTHLFRIAQETTNNAIKHSMAHNLSIELRADEREMDMIIADDGVGIDQKARPERSSMGLMTMNFRAQLIGARLTMTTQEGQGTRITITLPSTQMEKAITF